MHPLSKSLRFSLPETIIGIAASLKNNCTPLFIIFHFFSFGATKVKKIKHGIAKAESGQI